jgi:hypothetical protein
VPHLPLPLSSSRAPDYTPPPPKKKKKILKEKGKGNIKWMLLFYFATIGWNKEPVGVGGYILVIP